MDLSLKTEDGATISGTLYLPQRTSPPALILVHRYGADRKTWEPFAELLRGIGWMTLAIDLRGHGSSRSGPNGKSLDYLQIEKQADGWMSSLADIRTARQALLDHGANPKDLGVAGEELGASLALKYALSEPSIQAVVMLSPGLDLHGLHIEKDILKLKDCPVLLVTAENDAYSAMSASALKSAASVFSEIQRFSGSALGADLFASHPNVMNQIVDWLRPILDPSKN
jgi:pimeloyl-ACP methyl ester carboxylesterase